jgi:putative exporter of polyketide antibiotics
VSLPVSQQRVLEGIESALEGGEPRLRSMFAIFTRLTRDEGVPRTEALRAETLLRRVWPASGLPASVRTVIAIPLILGLSVLCIFMAVNSSAGHSCRPVSVLTPVTTCQSAQLPAGRT